MFSKEVRYGHISEMSANFAAKKVHCLLSIVMYDENNF